MPIIESVRDGEYPQFCTECGDELTLNLRVEDGWTWKYLVCPKYSQRWFKNLFSLNVHDNRLIDVMYQDKGKFDSKTGERINRGKS